MSAGSANGGVTYTVKELLAKIEGKLDGVIVTIGQKADKHDLENIADRVKVIEEQLTSIDAKKRTAEEVAVTLAAKKKADATLWEQWRLKCAWLLGLLVAVATVHSSFPHLP